MKVFWDTNVMLDLLGEREPFYTTAAQIATLADQRKIDIVASALSYGTVSYFLTKYYGLKTTIDKLRKFKAISRICKLDENIIERSLQANFPDFEDALQYFSALSGGCDFIITRNEKDFKKATIPVISPNIFILSFHHEKNL